MVYTSHASHVIRNIMAIQELNRDIKKITASNGKIFIIGRGASARFFNAQIIKVNTDVTVGFNIIEISIFFREG